MSGKLPPVTGGFYRADWVQPFPSPHRRKPTRPAFTLVELMVVVAVTSVMVGMLLPTVARVRDTARLIRCAGNLHQIVAAMAGYAATWHGVYPPNSSSISPVQAWSDLDKVGGGLVSHIPPNTNVNGYTALALVGNVYVCPNDWPDSVVLSYGMNAWASCKVSTSVAPGPTFAPKPYFQARLWSANVKRAAQMILVTEAYSGQFTTVSGVKLYYPTSPPTVGTAYAAGPAPSYSPLPTTSGQRFGGIGGVLFTAGRFGEVPSELCYYRHRPSGTRGTPTQARGRLNIAYADGHVASKSDADLVRPDGQSTGDSYWSPKDVPGF